MSTTDQRPTPSDQREPEASAGRTPDKAKIDLSLTQVVGGALAAMTAAFLGSRLSLAGTVAGAAVASIVAAVAGNVYTASLRTTREKVQTVFRGRIAGSDLPVTVEAAEDTFSWSNQPAAARTTTPPPARPHLRWRSVVVGALAVFALAAALLTGLELASGHSLSGGTGTTISQVTEQKPAADPSSDPTRAATASPTARATDTPTPSASTSSEPTPTPSVTEPTPSATASATPSSTPSASSTATPGTGSGAQTGAADQGAGTTVSGG